jgi:hypothetical protein
VEWTRPETQGPNGERSCGSAGPAPAVAPERWRTAPPHPSTSSTLVTHLAPTTPIWVTFEDRPGGCTAARLLPIFDRQGPPGRAYCKLDGPEVVVNVVEWALEQFQLIPQDFTWTMGH